MFHQSFYPRSKFHNHRMANQFYKTRRATFYPSGVRNNRSSQTLNFTRDFEGFSMATHAFTSIHKGQQGFWRGNVGRYPRQYSRAPIFHFQDKSTFYYMSDPIMTSDHRITIRLTKVHIGLNGDQQRVYVEQDFSSEHEYQKFVTNLRANFAKTFNHHEENLNTNNTKSGVVLIEEPDDEPNIPEQELQRDSSLTSNEQEQQLPLMSSCSTIQSNGFVRDRMKYSSQNENIPPKYPRNNDSSNFTNKLYGYQPRSRTNRIKDQDKPPFYRRVAQPRTIADNIIFTNNKQEQRPVDRSKSDCRSKIPIRIRTKPTHVFDDRHRYSTPLAFPTTSPRFYPNPSTQIPLFNPYQTHSNHFQCL